MSVLSPGRITSTVGHRMSKIDVICDYSNKELKEVPSEVLQLCNLKMLYLEGNCIEKLPDVIFQNLPKLAWLDLRNNNLDTLPRTVAHHQHLENLLLSNNNIATLPIELGLVPSLKVLLISGNPIVYPPQEIIDRSTPAICKFLKEEYESARQAALQPPPPPPSPPPETQSDTTAATPSVDQPDIIAIPRKKRYRRRTITKQEISILDLLRQPSIPTIVAKKNVQLPSVSVRALSKLPEELLKYHELYGTVIPKVSSSFKKIHRISKSCSKLSVHSYFNAGKHLEHKKDQQLITDSDLEELWLAKLKELITDQEKILQQERNLKALASWRTARKTSSAAIAYSRPPPPFDTDPNYDKMASRRELVRQIDKMISKTSSPAEKVDVQQMIDEVVSKLKSLETSCEEVKSPRAEIENAGRQIQSILQLHKKILQAQTANNTS